MEVGKRGGGKERSTDDKLFHHNSFVHQHLLLMDFVLTRTWNLMTGAISFTQKLGQGTDLFSFCWISHFRCACVFTPVYV